MPHVLRYTSRSMGDRIVILSTGGTGGHIYPAVSVAKELQKHDFDTVLMGQLQGMEERIAFESGLSFWGVQAGKLDRSRPNPMEFIRAGKGFLQARALLKQRRPLAVVGFGGFASLPGTLAAQSLGIPTVLHEQNAKLGLAQKMAKHCAVKIATAYPKVEGVRSSVWVGMPTREECIPKQQALAQLGLQENRLTALIMGGSQGSLALNRLLPPLLEKQFGPDGCLPTGRKIQVIHATGPQHLDGVVSQTQHLPWYHAHGFVDAVAAWSCADIGITRGGTGTLSEAAFHGVPLAIVPLPSSAEGHQFSNAQAVQTAGAGYVIEQSNIGALTDTIDTMLDEHNHTEMQKAAKRLSPEGATQRLADTIMATISCKYGTTH